MQQRVLGDGSSKEDRANLRESGFSSASVCQGRVENNGRPKAIAQMFGAKPKTRSRQAAKTTACLEIEPMEHAVPWVGILSPPRSSLSHFRCLTVMSERDYCKLVNLLLLLQSPGRVLGWSSAALLSCFRSKLLLPV